MNHSSAKELCADPESISCLLTQIYSTNSSNSNLTSPPDGQQPEHIDMRIFHLGLDFYAFLTPFIILTGLVGNTISLSVFTSRRMRKMSASLYLAALAISDNLTLLVYVFLDWLLRGVPRWPGAPTNGVNVFATPEVCQLYLYFSYVFRFLSAWIIVVFTGERYIGICKPLQRRAMCSNSFTKRALASVIGLALVLSVFKPLVATVKVSVTDAGSKRFCGNKEGIEDVMIVVDGVYAALITALPFIIILSLNILIIRRLRLTRRRHLRLNMATEESTVRLEFTAILLVVSSTFILLNLPYFAVWCYNFRLTLNNSLSIINPTEQQQIRGWLYVTKTIFYGNYCVNFFVYSLTGGYFRKQLYSLCSQVDPNCSSTRCRATQVITLPGSHTNGSLNCRESEAVAMLEVKHLSAVVR